MFFKKFDSRAFAFWPLRTILSGALLYLPTPIPDENEVGLSPIFIIPFSELNNSGLLLLNLLVKTVLFWNSGATYL